MNEGLPPHREVYVAEVLALKAEADEQLAHGAGEEDVARRMVKRRNELKATFRSHDPAEVVALLEMRNLRKYGHPLGPDADWFFTKYGSWRLVIEAACRPADLSRGL